MQPIRNQIEMDFISCVSRMRKQRRATIWECDWDQHIYRGVTGIFKRGGGGGGPNPPKLLVKEKATGEGPPKN